MQTTSAGSGPAPSIRALAQQAPPVALPAGGGLLEQDSEWFLVKYGGAWRELRLHDYPDIYSIPGLYEKIVYGVLRCHSPEVIRDELASAMREAGEDLGAMTVLDLGAGNGIVAEELRRAGVGAKAEGGFVGADLLPEAAEAAERDRPGLYGAFVVGDITDLPPKEEAKLEVARPDVLACVAALGFGDIPPEAFAAGFERVAPGGWVAFCIKEAFVGERDRSGFSGLIGRLIESGTIEVVRQKRYVHRVAMSGEALVYVAYIARKRGEIG